MYIESLYIQGIRNIQSLSLSLSSGIHQFIGRNGEGKTAILEAIQLLIVGASFRTHQLKEVMNEAEKSCFIEAHYVKNGVRSRISLGYDGSRRFVMINGEPQQTSSSLFGNILGVCATPLDCELVFGAPSERRRFIDEQIAQVDPHYIAEIRKLYRSLSQRNALLKQRDFKTIHVWEEQIARSSLYITRARYAVIGELASIFAEKVDAFMGRERIPHSTLSYHSTLFSRDEIGEKNDQEDNQSVEKALKLFHEKRENEARMGSTLFGPQRDDLLLTWRDGKSMKTQASLGQAKSVSLALRFAEWQLLYERSHGVKPLFLIDDLHSFLDQESVHSILKESKKLAQIFVSSHAPCHSFSRGVIFNIHAGAIASSHVFENEEDA